MTNILAGIFCDIEKERIHQQHRWGNATDDTINTPWHWVTYIARYSTKWMKGSFVFHATDVDVFRICMIKVAAIAIAAVESIDRQREMNGKPFYQE